MWVVQLKDGRLPKSVLNLMYMVALSKRAWVKFTVYIQLGKVYMRPRHGQICMAIYRRQTTYTSIWYTITDGTAVLMKVPNRHSIWRDYAAKVIDKAQWNLFTYEVVSI